jgi:hypothetical protein
VPATFLLTEGLMRNSACAARCCRCPIAKAPLSLGPTVQKLTNRWATYPLAFLLLASLSLATQACAGKSPSISSLSPTSGAVGTSITISGSNFGSSQGSSTVTFNGVTATATSWKTGTIVATVPTNATAGPVVVTVSGTPSNSVSFTVTPVISSLSPTSAPAGTSITIAGSGFGTSQGSNSVLFNGMVASVSSWGVGSITAAVPSSATSGPVVVSVNSISSNGAAFTVLSLVSIAVSPQNSSVAVGLIQQFTATATYSDQSTKDLTPIASWSSLNTAAATVGAFGMATGRGQGNTTITAIYGNASGSSTLTVTAPTIMSISITPSNNYLTQANSEQLTAIATYSDGSTQDVTSAVTWGSSNTAVASVSAAGLVTAGTAGIAMITAMDGGMVFSTTVTVTVQGPPTITASASPDPNAAGWNNSAVTVTFTCIPGTYPIAMCPSPQVVSTEGASQVISGTVTDTNGGMATASVTLNIDLTPPVLTVSNPTDGEVLTNSQISATGTVSDALSGFASMTCNQAPVTPSGDTFSCDTTLSPGLNLVVVRAEDVAGNVALVKMHVTLNAPLPPPTYLTIGPQNVTLVVGQKQQFNVIDDQERQRSDATWTVSNSTIATINSDSSPVLTAAAVGQVTLTATVQGVQAQEQVTIIDGPLSPGAAQWSVPTDGYNIGSVVPAIPSADGPGFYEMEYYTTVNNGQPLTYSQVRAFTADGQQMWQRSAGQGMVASVVSDGFGGLLIEDEEGGAYYLKDLDLVTGSVVWQEPFAPGDSYEGGPFNNGRFSMRPNGDFVLAGGEPGGTSGIYLVSGATGQATLLPLSQGTNGNSCGSDWSNGNYLNNTSITTDSAGNTYINYGLSHSTVAYDNCSNPQVTTTTQTNFVRLMTLDANGTASDALIAQSTASLVCQSNSTGWTSAMPPAGAFASPGSTNPDGQGGVLATWSQYPASESMRCAQDPPLPQEEPYPTQVTHISPSGSSQYELPAPLPSDMRILLGENGTAFISSADGYGSAVAFDINSGQIYWSHFVDQPILAATDDGGVLYVGGSDCTSPFSEPDNCYLTELDSTGSPTVLATLPHRSYETTFSWDGRWFNVYAGSTAATAIAMPSMTVADSFWAIPGGNESGTGLAIEQVQTNQTQGTTHQLPPTGSTLNTNYNSMEILTTVSPSRIFGEYIETLAGAQVQSGNDIATVPNSTNVTASGQTVQFTLRGVLGSPGLVKYGLGQGPFSVQIERFDTSADVLSAVTLQGHPLAGWRYWRVYSIGTNDLVVETGAADLPGPGRLDYWGYLIARNSQIKIWQEYLQYILADIRKNSNGQGDPNASQGSNPNYNHVQGEWGPAGPSQNNILQNVCQSTWCN